MLSEPSNNGELLTMLAEGVELIGESSLELLTGDIRELGFGDQRLGLGADEFLLEDYDLRAIWFLILELGDFVGNLLFPCEPNISLNRLRELVDQRTISAGLHGCFNVPNALDGHTVLVVTVDKLVLKLAHFVDQNTKLIRNV